MEAVLGVAKLFETSLCVSVLYYGCAFNVNSISQKYFEIGNYDGVDFANKSEQTRNARILLCNVEDSHSNA